MSPLKNTTTHPDDLLHTLGRILERACPWPRYSLLYPVLQL